MKTVARIVLASLLVLASPTTAAAYGGAAARDPAADESTPAAYEAAANDASESESAPAADDDAFGHGTQFGLRAALVAGYRMVLRYDDSPLCREFEPEDGDDQATFCGHTAPLAIDLGLSFAPLDSLEPFVWARFGLAKEEETDTLPVVIVGAGARIYTMSDSAFKIFVEPAIGIELENGENPLNDEELDYDTDFVFHLAAGPQIDVARNFGIYADAGLTMGILRSIHSSLELKLGVQGRLP